MFHLQLRQFPHNHRQFNLTEADVSSFAELWVRGEWLRVGERQWSPRQAELTVIEAPRVASAQLSMGRGWRHVERAGEDVTQRVLAAVASPASGGTVGAGRTARRESEVESRTRAAILAGEVELGLGELGALLGEGIRARELLEAWRSAAARFPDRSPSESLALAERELDSARSKPHRH